MMSLALLICKIIVAKAKGYDLIVSFVIRFGDTIIIIFVFNYKHIMLSIYNRSCKHVASCGLTNIYMGKVSKDEQINLFSLKEIVLTKLSHFIQKIMKIIINAIVN